MASASRLTQVLADQVTILKELQQNLQDEQRAIASLDTHHMESLNSQKEQIIHRQRVAAEALRGAMVDAAGQLGVACPATLGELILKMPAAMKAQVEPLQVTAKQVSATVSALAHQNRLMLERFLGVVNESLSFILRILNTSNTYGVRGTYLSNMQSGAVMVSKEA